MLKSCESCAKRVTPCDAEPQRIFGKGTVRQSHLRYNVRSKYQFVRNLGKGTYGKVKLAVENSTGRKYAVKTIRKDRIKDKKDMTHIRREMTVMSSLYHPNIIQIHEVFENQDKIVIVMEYASKGELYDYLADKKLTSEEESRVFFKQIVSAVQYCHRLGVVHRDLKLENILLGENYEIKIADFGLANLFRSDQLLETFCGSPLYASPEIVNGVPYTGPEVDSWSLGVLLYALVYGMMPFDGSDNKTLTKQISNGDYSRQTKYPDAADLIDKMLTVDPRARADIYQVENHYWLLQTPSPIPAVLQQNSEQITDKNSNYLYPPKEATYPVTAATAPQYLGIASAENSYVPQSTSPIPISNGYISPIPVSNRYISPIPVSNGYISPIPVSNGYISPIPISNGYISPIPVSNGHISSRQAASKCLVEPDCGTVHNPRALKEGESTTCQRKGILKRIRAPAATDEANFTATPARTHATLPPQYASLTRSSCLNGELLAKDASCGLQAKDSLKLKSKPLGASGKRRNLRTKKDRESGYYSSPERTPVDIKSVQSAAPVFNFAAPVIKPQLTTMTQHGLKPRQIYHPEAPILPPPQFGLPTFGYVVPIQGQPIPIIEGPAMSYYPAFPVQNPMEPPTGSLLSFTVAPLNDEANLRTQRPISSYSDSSILSSDSFELCTFESPLNSAALLTTVGLAPSNTVVRTTQPASAFVLSAAVQSASLPVMISPPPADTGRSSPEPSGALTPTSAKLNHDLSQILSTPNRRRRRQVDEETFSDSQPAELCEEQASQLEEMMRQLNLDLERACKKGLDMRVSLTTRTDV